MQKLLGSVRGTMRSDPIVEARHPRLAEARLASSLSSGDTSGEAGKTRYHVLDLLRIVAASAAMIYHYAFRGYTADGLSIVRFDDLSPVVRYGHTGSFFFLISSFVI